MSTYLLLKPRTKLNRVGLLQNFNLLRNSYSSLWDFWSLGGRGSKTRPSGYYHDALTNWANGVRLLCIHNNVDTNDKRQTHLVYYILYRDRSFYSAFFFNVNNVFLNHIRLTTVVAIVSQTLDKPLCYLYASGTKGRAERSLLLK